MESYFRIDGPIYRVLLKVWQFLVLNLLILLTSLPLVTVGVSQTAGFVVMKRMIEVDEGKIIQTYFQAFKKNFKKSTLLWLVVSIGSYFLWLDWQYVLKIESSSLFILIGVFLVTVIVLNLGQYGFFYQSTFDDTLGTTIKNTLKLFFKRPIISLLLILLFILPILMLLLSSELMVFTLYSSLFFGFSLHLYLRTLILLKVFDSMIHPENLSKRSFSHEHSSYLSSPRK